MNTTHWKLWMLALVTALGLAAGCGDSEPAGDLTSQGGEIDENGKPVLNGAGWEEPSGKSDALQGRQGLPTSVDSSPTTVWEVHNRWHDTDTADAREAGMAWPENSGLTWEEKYRRWVGSLEKTDSAGWGETFMMTTPWGKKVPAPSLECAEIAIFLRVAFANWYGLPYFMEGRDREGRRLYFGHFGVRTRDGRWSNMPNFRERYRDYRNRAENIMAGDEDWPRDENLAGLSIPGSFDDEQEFLGEDKHAGAYFDEVFLNKRVGYFMRLHLVYFGSINLADPVNMFNVEADAVDSGDVLLERWQRTGIGHTLVVMRRRNLGELERDGEVIPQIEAELASGSMPRRQPVWESAAASKRYFTMAKTGGDDYAEYGGGIKRWRVAREVGGRWTNVVPTKSQDHWVNSSDLDAIAARPDRFEEILTELGPEEKMDVILGVIEAKRAHLQNYPASCAARIAREEAFDDLYEVAADAGMSRQDVDDEYRTFADYVFAELVYNKSKTCCWNSSTSQMYELAIDYNLDRVHDEENDMCGAIEVFKARDDEQDGFQLFREYAESVDQGDEWVTWSADESCSQANVSQDTEADHDWTPFCEVNLDATP